MPCTLIDPANIKTGVLVIRDEVRRIQRLGAGSYLFIADATPGAMHEVFILSELRSITPHWLRDHFRWLVAFYSPRRKDGSKRNPDGTPYLTATEAGLTEDITEHLADLRRVMA
jgi:hypothetical protein